MNFYVDDNAGSLAGVPHMPVEIVHQHMYNTTTA